MRARAPGISSRPGLQRALGMLKRAEADALLVLKVDRLTRSVRDLGHLVEKYFAPGSGPKKWLPAMIQRRSGHRQRMRDCAGRPAASVTVRLRLKVLEKP